MQNKKSFIKISFLITLIVASVIAILYFSISATADENKANETNHTVSGTIYEYGTTTTLSGVTVDAFKGIFSPDSPTPYQTTSTDSSGKFYVTAEEGSCISLQFYYANSPNSDTYAGNRIFVDTPIMADIDLDTLEKKPDLTLHKFTQNVTGKVSDENGNGIGNALIEFYNPSGFKSPYADTAVYTKADGTYDLIDHIVSESYYNGVGIGTNYQVVVTTDECEKQYISATKDLKVIDGTNTLDFVLSRIVKVRLYDYDQTENGWAEWYHELYIDGALITEGSYLGDSLLHVPTNVNLSIKQNCTLEMRYTNDSGECLETFTPAFRIAEDWEPTIFDDNLIGDCWLIGINTSGVDEPTTECYEGYKFSADQDTSRIYLDVRFKDKRIPDPDPDPGVIPVLGKTTNTGDFDDSLLLLMSITIELAALVLLISWIKKVKAKRSNL